MAKKRRHATKSAPVATNNKSDSEDDFTTRKGQSIKAITSYDQVMDSEDEFHEQRDSIDFESAVQRRNDVAMRKVKKNGKNVWEQDFGQDDQVLSLDIDDSEDDADDDDDDDVDEDVLDRMDKEDDRLLAKSNRYLKTARDYEDEDDEIIDRKSVGGTLQTKAKKKEFDEDEAVQAWGRSRKNFYNRDEEVISDEEAMREELAETLKMQQRRVEAMDEADFLGDDDEELGGGGAKATFGDSLIKRLRGTAAATAETEEDDLTFGGVHVEKVDSGLKRDALAKMDASALKSLAESQIPEIVGYLKEFDERWDEVKNVLGPSLKWMKEQEDESEKVPTRLLEAKEYLELRYRILLSYLHNILFYLALRANPPSNLSADQIHSHPVTKVIANLSHLLSRLEKRVEGRKEEPEEEAPATSKKGKNSKKNAAATVPTVEEPESEGFVNLLDRISEFVDARLDGEEFDEDSDDDDNEIDDDEDDQENEGSMNDDDENDEDLLNEEEMRQVLATLKAEKGSKKKGSKAAVVEPAESKEEEDEDEEFKIPEFHSTKPAPTAKDKKASKKAMAAAANDFGEVDLNQVDMHEKMSRKRDLQFHVKRLDQDLSKRAKYVNGTGDADIPLRDKWGQLVPTKFEDEKPDPSAIFSADAQKQQQKKKAAVDDDLDDDDVHDPTALDDEDYHGEDYHGYDEEDEAVTKRKRGDADDGEDDDVNNDDQDDEALAYYNAVANAKKARKDAKEDKFQAYKKTLEGDLLYDDNDMTAPGTKRSTGWTIDANKGLTPRRKKEDRNGRVKIKNKFAKKLKKLSSVKAIVKDKSKLGAYKGEMTGIKANLAKSVKF
ncbi:hypothetical protein BDR26DRAFT_855666 [Obelidium mucronatum]|nr:hypothetical protein BDR26DRAFT_855666 [Obelidium mucronatum]